MEGHRSDKGDEIFQAASEYFADVFPDSVINIDQVPMPEEALQNLIDAGFYAAEIIEKDNSRLIATFIVKDTCYTKAVGAIHFDESSGLLPAGSHN